MTKIKVEKHLDPSVTALDKTDWNKLYRQTQQQIDKEAMDDKENPVLDNAKFHHLKDRS